jgi:hypothetical protein
MAGLRHKLADVWDKLNPSEPSPLFLVKFMALAVVLFALAYLVGRL